MQSRGIGRDTNVSILARLAVYYLKTLQPRNLVTESGEGWAASITQCRLRLMTFPFFCANPPHRMNTTPRLEGVGVVSQWNRCCVAAPQSGAWAAPRG